MKFADPFDLDLAQNGPPGLFTLSHDGELQFDLFRTRNWRRRFLTSEKALTASWNHCVCIDTQTHWPMYVLITARELVCSDTLTITKVFDSAEDALTHIKKLKTTLYESSGNKSSGEGPRR